MNQVPENKIINKISALRHNRRAVMAASWFAVLLGPILVLTTVYLFQVSQSGRASGLLRGILLVDLVYLLALVSLLGFSVMKIFAARRAQSAGSRLHMRLASVFAVSALIPTVLVAVFAVLTLNIGIESWFSENVRNVVGSSLNAAEAYKAEQSDDLEEDLGFISFNLEQFKNRNQFVSDGDVRVQMTRLQTLVQRGLKEAYIVDGIGGLKSRGQNSYLFDYEKPSVSDLAKAEKGEVVIIEDWPNNEFRALVRLNSFADRYLYISRSVDGEILSLLDSTTQTAQTYNDMESQREQLLSYYGLMYLAFAAFVILGSIWMGMIFAERLSRPVGRLAGAAQRLGSGDFDVQVAEERGDDEIAMLGRVFNRMSRQVKRQRDDLIEANERTERRRRLFDSVLSSVTAGVIGLSPDGEIGVMNAAAVRLLNLDPTEDVDKPIELAVPEFAKLFKQLNREDEGEAQEEINLTRAGNAEVLLVRIARRFSKTGLLEGYVVTFDDVTDLVSAQRMAAWGDVARRIAHEIKNPLTPIQLSAERLRRKFGPMLGDEEESLSQYSDVIIRQTNDLRRIVDEFSKFARMPEPKKQDVLLDEIIAASVLLQDTALKDVRVKFENKLGAVCAEVDETMMGQAITNLIKNAGEAIEAKIKQGVAKSFSGQIRVILQTTERKLEILIQDNGIGLPVEQRSRLFEPYVTNREGGTGLGLSIVKKIIEEHGGTLELSDAPAFSKTKKCGAMATIRFEKTIIKNERKTTKEVA